MKRREELVWLVPPIEPGAKGARGSWRVRSSWLPYESKKGRNWERSSRDPVVAEQLLKARRAELVAYAVAVNEAEDRGEDVADVDAGHLTFGDIAREWLDHQHRAGQWGTSQQTAQRSLLHTWLLGETILVPTTPRVGAQKVRFAEVQLAQMLPFHVEEALLHVYEARSHATYKKVRQLVRTIFTWARANQRCPANVAPAAALPVWGPRRGNDRNVGVIPPERIPDAALVEKLAATSLERTGVWWRRLEIELLAAVGMRIGELLGMRNFPHLWQENGGVLWTLLDEQWNGGELKSREARWVPIPTSLRDDVERRLAEVGHGEHLFSSPEGRPYNPDNWRKRIFNPAADMAGWPARRDYCHDHRKHQGEPDSTCTGQDRRRWVYPTHSLRHFAVTNLMDRDGLDDDDVALIVGHTTGAQLRRMYKQRRHQADVRLNATFANL